MTEFTVKIIFRLQYAETATDKSEIWQRFWNHFCVELSTRLLSQKILRGKIKPYNPAYINYVLF